jgi:hypothetical protein
MYLALGLGRSRQLLHVDVRRVQKAAFFGDGQHRHGAVLALGHQVGAFAGIHGNIDFHQLFHAAELLGVRARTDAHLFPDVEHGGLIAGSLPNDDAAAHGDLVQFLPHGLDGHLIGGLVVAFAHPTGGGDGSLLHHFDDL